MKNFRTLKFLDKFKRLFDSIGIDYPVMRKILQVKLTMDQRRVPTIFNQSGKKKGDENKNENRFIKSLWIYALYGLFLVPFLLFGNNYIFQMSIIFGVLMFIITTSMISDFSSVLLDIRDKTVLGTKPINQKTMNAAKTLHICIYLFFLTGALTAIPLVVSLVKHGIAFFIIFLVEIVLIDLLIVVLTALLYFLILRFFDGEKLKDIINYVQIALSIGIAVGYQFVARSFEIVELNVTFTPMWWQFFIPPMWYGAPYELLLKQNTNTYFIVLSLLAIIIPILAIFIYVKMIASFERHLQKLSDHSSKVKSQKGNRRLAISNIICSSKEEKAFYRFGTIMMKNEREFKLKVYPALGFSLIFPFIFLFNEVRMSSLAEVADSKWYLSIYFASMMISTVIMMLKYSGKYKGSWIYKTTPINKLSSLFKGTLKAFIVRLLLPVYIPLCAVYIFLFGIRILPDLITIFLSFMLYTIISFKFLHNGLPFSESFDAVQQSDGWKVLPFLLLTGVFFGIHYFSTMFSYGVYMYMGILLVVNIIAWRVAFPNRWEKIK
jgi:ABC-2 type transport system permease protein